MCERFIRAATIRDTLLLLFYSIVATLTHTLCGNGNAVEDRFNARESENESENESKSEKEKLLWNAERK